MRFIENFEKRAIEDGEKDKVKHTTNNSAKSAGDNYFDTFDIDDFFATNASSQDTHTKMPTNEPVLVAIHTDPLTNERVEAAVKPNDWDFEK